MYNNNFLANYIASLPPVQAKEYVPVRFNYFSQQAFDNTIANLDNMSDLEVMDFIKMHIKTIENKAIRKDQSLLEIFYNWKFLYNYRIVIDNLPFDHLRRTIINMSFYNYSCIDKSQRRSDVYDLLRDMSLNVNKKEIKQLMAYGLDRISAHIIVCSRYSSIIERINILRMNFYICTFSSIDITEQMIVWIYETLFESVTTFFITTLLEFPTITYNWNTRSELLEFEEIRSRVYNVVLLFVDNLPYNDIRSILTSYSREWMALKCPKTAISLNHLSSEYSRIRNIVSEINANGNFIP